MTREKRKRDLLTTLHHIERYHQRRMALTIHALVSIGIQITIWVNWYASYAARGVGFENNFFADRVIIAAAMALFLLGHYLVVRLSEAKDRAVVRAVMIYQPEDADIPDFHSRLMESTDDEDEELLYERSSNVQHSH